VLGASGKPVRPAAPDSSRAALERRLAAPLVFLTRLPRWLPFAVVLVLVVVAVLVNGVVGAVALLVVAALLALLGYLSWPALEPSGRALRVGTVGVVIAVAIALAVH
jgi:sterol desaturase/sphingolipid hydroxylase (fatty acid hydroxylase superfamily)